jgi:uncharacterized protein (TIGR02001 family)
MKFKHLFAGAVVGASVLASPAVLADRMTGNVGVTSDYVFRGISMSDGTAPAVQGGLDYTFSFDMYTGLWISSASALGASGRDAGGNEADLYAGYAMRIGKFDLTAGAIYYAYTEAHETSPGSQDINFYEGFVGAGFGPVAVKVFYTPDYGLSTNSKEALYATATVKLDLTDTITILPQVGFSSGDGIKNVWGEEYVDYSITGVKKLKDDWSVSLMVVNTNIKDPPAAVAGGVTYTDSPKFVIGLKKGFKL